jgi:uncharacterized protein (TIGR04255 family)
MPFEPVNKSHAIAEAIVFFEFTPNLQPVMPQLLQLKDELKERLPKAELSPSMQVQFNPNGQINFVSNNDLKLSTFASDGALRWQLNITQNSISVHCIDYTRWNAVWLEMRSFIAAAFKHFGASPVVMSGLGLKYIDRFIWSGSEDDYATSDLFKQDAVFLSGSSFKSGARWHCHTGWFARHEHSEILNQLNVDSARNVMAGRPAVVVTVDHAQLLRSDNVQELSEFGKVPGKEPEKLDALMDRLHNDNRGVILELLIPQMATRIGLLRDE